MSNREARTTVEAASAALRAMVLGMPSGTLIGNEDVLIDRLGCARSTVKQVARLLEREGLLQVRRGNNGGYFGARPDARTIEASVSSHLEALHVDPNDVTLVASALWVEVVRKAASTDATERQILVELLTRRIKTLKPNASFEQIRDLELFAQAEIFKLARAPYVKLIFDINVAFTKRRLAEYVLEDDAVAQSAFMEEWRDAKLLEIAAIRRGDAEFAAMAARHSRMIWHQRVLARYVQHDNHGNMDNLTRNSSLT
jgi:DNA-binding FadR family transcriptional regulator